MANQCECGCGEPIEPKPHHKYTGTPKFRPGHQARVGALAAHREAIRAEVQPPNPSGLCMCGCGQPTPTAKATIRKQGILKDHPLRYIHGHGMRGRGDLVRGERSGKWKGGRIINRGYVLLRMPDHHLADPKGYVAEHRLVAEQTFGRPLTTMDHVHHINGDPTDNRPENLRVVTRSEHSMIHARKVVPYLNDGRRAAGEKRRKTVITLYEHGWTIAAMADALGVTQRTIRRDLDRLRH